MPFVTIVSSRYAQDAPVSTDLFGDIVGDLNFLNTNNTSAVDAGGVPLVVNGSFEADANGTPGASMTGWVWAPGTGGTGTVTNAQQNHGAQSFLVTRDTTAGHSGGTITSTTFMNVSPSSAYQVRFSYFATEADVRVIGTLNWFASTGAANGTSTFYDTGVGSNAKTSWTLINSLVFIPPASTAYAKIVFTLGDSSQTPAGTTSIYIDGIMVAPRSQFITTNGYTTNSSLTIPSGVFAATLEGWGQAFTSGGGKTRTGGLGGYFRVPAVLKPGDVVTISFSAGTTTVTAGGNTFVAQAATSTVDGIATSTNGGITQTGGSVLLAPYAAVTF